MHCELVVPALLSPGCEARAPALELLLARGRRRREEARSLEAWLGPAFGVAEGPLPAGALSLLAAGGEPGTAAWARADPVHLRLMRDRLILVPADAFSVPDEEAAALCAALEAHFPGHGLRCLDARRWCMRLEHALASPPAPLDMAGREVMLARDADPLLNEMQMLLHAHPVNAAREARGEPAVNSVWLWGPGTVPGSARAPWQSVAADEPAALGLARLAGARRRALPASAAEWLGRLPEDGRHLAVLDALRAPHALEEAAAYHERLAALERDWFAPLLAALKSGRVGMVSIHVPDAGAAFEAIRGDLRRFWRRPRTLGHYA